MNGLGLALTVLIALAHTSPSSLFAQDTPDPSTQIENFMADLKSYGPQAELKGRNAEKALDKIHRLSGLLSQYPEHQMSMQFVDYMIDYVLDVTYPHFLVKLFRENNFLRMRFKNISPLFVPELWKLIDFDPRSKFHKLLKDQDKISPSSTIASIQQGSASFGLKLLGAVESTEQSPFQLGIEDQKRIRQLFLRSGDDKITASAAHVIKSHFPENKTIALFRKTLTQNPPKHQFGPKTTKVAVRYLGDKGFFGPQHSDHESHIKALIHLILTTPTPPQAQLPPYNRSVGDALSLRSDLVRIVLKYHEIRFPEGGAKVAFDEFRKSQLTGASFRLLAVEILLNRLLNQNEKKSLEGFMTEQIRSYKLGSSQTVHNTLDSISNYSMYYNGLEKSFQDKLKDAKLKFKTRNLFQPDEMHVILNQHGLFFDMSATWFHSTCMKSISKLLK